MAVFKYPVRINFGITAYGSGDFNTQKILLDDFSAPHVYLSGAKKVSQCIETLFAEYFDYNIDWTHLKFVSAETIKEESQTPELHLNYICLASPAFEPKKGEWSNFIEVYTNKDGKFKHYEEIITKIGDVIF
jgi:hypothetical protein